MDQIRDKIRQVSSDLVTQEIHGDPVNVIPYDDVMKMLQEIDLTENSSHHQSIYKELMEKPILAVIISFFKKIMSVKIVEITIFLRLQKIDPHIFLRRKDVSVLPLVQISSQSTWRTRNIANSFHSAVFPRRPTSRV